MGKRNTSSADVNRDLTRYTTELKALRIAYEKYFAGVDKREPLTDRQRLKKAVQQLRSRGSYNTATKFRLEQLMASFINYETHWNRICKRIEEGTYHRHKARVARATTAVPQTAAADDAPATPANVAKGSDPSATADPLATLHRAYVNAQTQTGQDKAVSIEALRRTISKQSAVIKERYGCKDVDFKVAIKNGKPILRAIPRK